ncbi:kinase-like domain-containing protein [Gautieria morchelliformis]|nr:kinase-like domain-containing protein [Gautieria morchelliformis]
MSARSLIDSQSRDIRFSELTRAAMLPPACAEFFASISTGDQILSSKEVSVADVVTGGYNTVSICELKVTECPSLRFILRVPIDDPDSHPVLPRWQTTTAVGCMLYCRRNFHDLGIPTPEVYAFSASPGSEFIAMEYIDGEDLSDVWMDLSLEEKEHLIGQVAEVMRKMRSQRFSVIGGISPDGLPSPIVNDVDASNGRAELDQFGLYNIGPYESLREWVLSCFDRQIHYFDQMLHHETLKQWEARFKMEMEDWLHLLTPETVLEKIKSKRDAFIHADQLPFDSSHPFVLRHGDFHGRNVLVSRTSPRTIVAVIDWDFGGSQALPLADDDFEVISGPDDAKEAQEQEHWRKRIDELIGKLPFDYGLVQASHAMTLVTLEREQQRVADELERISRLQ